MAARAAHQAPTSAGMLSIGALSRASGIPIDTLRTWEHRYGFPASERKPSGHRVYATTIVPRLRRMAQAIASGHRAGEIVPASDVQLDSLMGVTGGDAAAPAPPIPPSASIDDLLALVEQFDGERLAALLLSDWGRLGPVEFVATRTAPLIGRVGDAWRAGRLEIRHEHFLSERLGDLMRSLRLPLDHQARGPVVVCATLPGEAHTLGIQMAALVLAAAGCRVVYFGSEMPPAELAAIVRDLSATAVAVSISSAADRHEASRHLARLRRGLGRAVRMLVGGAGAPASRGGHTTIQDFGQLDAWARRLDGPDLGGPARPAR